MPVLPDPNQLSRPALRGGGGIVTAEGGIAEGAAAHAAESQWRGIQQTTGALAGLGRDVIQIAQEERKRLVGLRVQEEDAQLRDFSVEALQGEGGALRAEQGAVLTPDYFKKHAERFETEIKRREAALPTDEHRAEFKPRAEALRSQYLRSIYSHMAAETDKYQDTSYNAAKTSYHNSASAQYADPQAVKANVEGMRALATNRAAQQGITDPAVLGPIVLEEVGGVHQTIIDSARRAGSIQYANEYFGIAKGEMSAEQVAAVEQTLKPATSYATGSAIGQAAIDLFDRGTPEKDIQAMILKEAGSDPQAAGAARAILVDAKNARQEDRQKTVGTGVLTFLNAGMTAEAFVAVMQDDATLALPPDERAKMQEHFMSLMSAQGRSAKAEQKETWDSQEAYERFADMMQRDDLGSLPEEQIYALQPDIGPAKVSKIIAERRSRLAGGAKFTIDPDILKEATPPALLTSRKKGELAAFKGVVESNLADWKAANPGMLPDLTTQKRIARSALAEYEAPGMLWGTNKKPLYAAPADEREYRRLEAMRPDWESGMRAEAAKRGLSLTDTELKAMWAKKLEKAK